MTADVLPTGDYGPALDAVVAAYLKAVETGQPVDRAAWLARHPELADELADFFADLDQIEGAVGPVRSVWLGPGAEETAPVGRGEDGPAPHDSVGEYELLGELGRGGMGVVYEARQRKLGRLVALKMLRGDGAGEELYRLRQEAEVIALLDHPNIVPVLEVGEAGGRAYFTMKLIRGRSLAEHLPRYTAAPHAAARLVAVVARAVHHAHQRGVLHRDLKPSNILLADEAPPAEAVPYVTDFGLARRLQGDADLTRSGAVIGTPAYMAPEMASGRARAATTAVDVYGLGAVLYALLTGKPPFAGADVLEVIAQVRERDPEAPRRLNPLVDRDLETICLRCLHKEPARRYASAAAVADDLERYLRGDTIRARPAGRAERAWRWCRRNPALAALLAMAAALLLLLVFAAQSVRASRAGQAQRAGDLARAVDVRFQLVGHAVRLTAGRKELRKLLARPEGLARRAELQAFLKDTRDGFNQWFTWSAEESLVNWFVLGPDGTILADSFAQSRAVGKKWPARDYARLLAQPALLDPDVALVFHSTQDGLYKFAFVTRIRDGDRVLGLLAATVPTDARLLGLDLNDEPAGAMVACQFDLSYSDAESEFGPGAWVVVLHRDYARPGQRPAWVGADRQALLRAFDDSARKRGSGLTAGGVADAARVGRTRYVVLIENPRPWLLGALGDVPWGWWPALAAALVGAGLLVGRWRRRARVVP